MVGAGPTGYTDHVPKGARVCAAHQPNLLPWAGFMAKLACADEFVIADDVQYVKQNFVNRCRLPGANGPLWLSIPVERSGKFGQRQREVRIDHSQNWHGTFVKTLRHRYAKTELYPEIGSRIERAIDERPVFLLDLNLRLVQELNTALGITTPMHLLSDLGITTEDRCRRIVDLTLACGCRHYLAGKGASIHYMVEEPFVEANISYSYYSFSEDEYPQETGSFVTGCSIIDSLFRTGVAVTRSRIGLDATE